MSDQALSDKWKYFIFIFNGSIYSCKVEQKFEYVTLLHFYFSYTSA